MLWSVILSYCTAAVFSSRGKWYLLIKSAADIQMHSSLILTMEANTLNSDQIEKSDLGPYRLAKEISRSESRQQFESVGTKALYHTPLCGEG